MVSEPKKKGLSPRGSKAKGDKYERELAAFFNERLYSGQEKVFRTPLSPAEAEAPMAAALRTLQAPLKFGSKPSAQKPSPPTRLWSKPNAASLASAPPKNPSSSNAGTT